MNLSILGVAPLVLVILIQGSSGLAIPESPGGNLELEPNAPEVKEITKPFTTPTPIFFPEPVAVSSNVVPGPIVLAPPVTVPALVPQKHEEEEDDDEEVRTESQNNNPSPVHHQILDLPVVLDVVKRVEAKEKLESVSADVSDSKLKPVEPVKEQIEVVTEGDEGFEPVVLILTLEPGHYNLYRTAEGNLVKLVEAGVVDSLLGSPNGKSESDPEFVPREKCFSIFSSKRKPDGDQSQPNGNPGGDNSGLQQSQQQPQYQLTQVENALPQGQISASTVYFPRETPGGPLGLRYPSSPSYFLPARTLPPLLLKNHLGPNNLGHPIAGFTAEGIPVPFGVEVQVPIDVKVSPVRNPGVSSPALVSSNQEKSSNVNPDGKSEERKKMLEKSIPIHQNQNPIHIQQIPGLALNEQQYQYQHQQQRPSLGRPVSIRARKRNQNQNQVSKNQGRWFWNSYYDYPTEYDYDYDYYYDYNPYYPQSSSYYPYNYNSYSYYRTAGTGENPKK